MKKPQSPLTLKKNNLAFHQGPLINPHNLLRTSIYSPCYWYQRNRLTHLQKKGIMESRSQTHSQEAPQMNFESLFSSVKYISMPVRENLIRTQRRSFLPFSTYERQHQTISSSLSMNQISTRILTSSRTGLPLFKSFPIFLGPIHQRTIIRMPLWQSLFQMREKL